MSNNSINRLLLIVGSVVSVATLFGVGCACSDFVFGAVDLVTLSIPSSCMISATGSTVHEVTVTSGLIKNAESTSDPISKSRITATCNDANGYSIYAIGYSNDIEGTTAMIAGDPLTSENNIATGNATTGNTSNWGMKVIASTGTDAPTINTTDAGGSFVAYRAVPTAYTKVASKASGVVTTNTSYIDTAYQVYISTSQPAGSYSGKVKYVLINPGMSSEELPEGYEVNSQGQLVKAACAGYQKMQDIAIFKDSLALEEQTQLCDARDGKVYWVAKLKDGNIWMTQNLDYDVKSSGNEVAVVGGTTTTWNSSYPAHATETTLSNHTGYTDTYSWDPGDYYIANGGSSSACSTWRPTSTCQGTTKLSYDLTSTDAKDEIELHYHLGNYYQWNTATAGYGGTETSKYINYSICPKGWRLPTSNSYTENYSFGKLTNVYGITNSTTGSSDANLIKSPLWFVRAGSVAKEGVLELQGTYERVWSGLATTNASVAYRLQLRNSLVDPSNSGNRNLGFSVRCVAE